MATKKDVPQDGSTDTSADVTSAAAKNANTTPDNAGVSDEVTQSQSGKPDQVENADPQDETNPARDLEGVDNEQDRVSGQNHVAAVVSDERDFGEQAAALARENDENLAPEWAAGDDYLYPKLPVSAQNPPKNVVIAYKYDPTGEANNS